ncbi:unnamed protein product [Rhodiola kirilowii]
MQRKLEKELVYSRGGPSNDPEENEPVVDEDVEDDQPKESISGTTTYDNGDIQVTVTTSEISRKEEVHLPSQKQQPEPAATVEESTKKLKTAVKMKPTKINHLKESRKTSHQNHGTRRTKVKQARGTKKGGRHHQVTFMASSYHISIASEVVFERINALKHPYDLSST